jgi:hypothetical protein
MVSLDRILPSPRVPTSQINVIEMTNDDLEHYITQRIIPDLKHEGFDSSIESDSDDEYVTLTIQRHHRYY